MIVKLDGVSISCTDGFHLIVLDKPFVVWGIYTIEEHTADVGTLSIAPFEVNQYFLVHLGNKTETFSASTIRLYDTNPWGHHVLILLLLPSELYTDASQIVGVFVFFHRCTTWGAMRINFLTDVRWIVACRRNAFEGVTVLFISSKGVLQPDDENLVLIHITFTPVSFF